MASEALFRVNANLREAQGQITGLTQDGGLILDRTIFYPTGGGQPGDSGWLEWQGGRCAILVAQKGGDGAVVLRPEAGATMPAVGTEVTQTLDWARRYGHMRVHTALHLLSVVVPLPVTGGQIAADHGRLDFDMPDPPADLAEIGARLNRLIQRALPVSDMWITEEELAANPGLVKTLRVKPPQGQGRVRLVRIGQGADQVDLQPCGGTHVANTGEIGAVTLGKIENKGRQNRRITLLLGN